MPYSPILQQPSVDALEQLIDAHGVYPLLDAVFRICHEKADHIDCYPDKELASAWRFMARQISKATDAIAKKLPARITG